MPPCWPWESCSRRSSRNGRANSAEAREAAQQAALAADAAVAETLGTAALRRRRMLAEPSDNHVTDDRDYHERIRRAVMDATPRGRTWLRRVVARYASDSGGIIGRTLANHVAAHLLRTAAGRIGLMDAEPMQGVDRKTAEAFELRRSIVGRCGYTVGWEVSGDRVPSSYWKRAAKAHNSLAAALRAKSRKAQDVAPETIRTWCRREERELFRKARRDGRRDRATGRRNLDQMLA